MRLDLAVCTDRDDAPLATTLPAVLGQVPHPLVVIAGVEDAAARRLEAITLDVAPGARVVRDPGPGLAHARNAALACCEGDVLCLLDDDAVPVDGWFAGLRAIWDHAGEGLAAAGGPVRAALEDPPPWMAPDQISALGSVDHGDEERDIDPAQHTLMGANLSLRVSAARGVGGFWPAHGRRGARDWYSEEHHLQRELGLLGWRVRWAPRAAVSRVVEGKGLTPRSVLARRFRYGARVRAGGGARSPAAALRQALSSSGGTAAATVRGQRDVAMSRAARATENAGFLLGERLVRADFEPTGPTPFRASVPVPKRRRRTSGDGALVMLYHRVAEVADDPLGLTVPPRHFAEQLEVLRQGRVLGIEELAALVRAGRRPPCGAVAITFDDGYHDNLAHAAPALERAGLPATVFVATVHVATGAPFFWDELQRLLTGSGERPASLTLELGGDVRAWRTPTPAARARVRRYLHEWLQPRTPEEIDAVLATLREWAGDGGAGGGGHRPLTVAELRTLAARPGIAIGAHSRRHPNLAHRPREVQSDEISGSREDLRGWLGTSPSGFSYPFGVPGSDFDGGTKDIVRRGGFDYAVANSPGLVGRDSDLYALPRVVVPDVGGAAFAGWLDGVRRGGV